MYKLVYQKAKIREVYVLAVE